MSENKQPHFSLQNNNWIFNSTVNSFHLDSIMWYIYDTVYKACDWARCILKKLLYHGFNSLVIDMSNCSDGVGGIRHAWPSKTMVEWHKLSHNSQTRLLSNPELKIILSAWCSNLYTFQLWCSHIHSHRHIAGWYIERRWHIEMISHNPRCARFYIYPQQYHVRVCQRNHTHP